MTQLGPLARSINAHKILFDPDDSRPVYIGINQEFYATTTAATWQIIKFTYTTTTASDVTRIDKTRGTYSGRVALFP